MSALDQETRSPVPGMIPDRVLIRMRLWGVPLSEISAGVQRVSAVLERHWQRAPDEDALNAYFINRENVRHGAATALLADRLARAASDEPIDTTELITRAILSDTTEDAGSEWLAVARQIDKSIQMIGSDGCDRTENDFLEATGAPLDVVQQAFQKAFPAFQMRALPTMV